MEVSLYATLAFKTTIIIVIYRKNHPPFPLNCYLYA